MMVIIRNIKQEKLMVNALGKICSYEKLIKQVILGLMG